MKPAFNRNFADTELNSWGSEPGLLSNSMPMVMVVGYREHQQMGYQSAAHSPSCQHHLAVILPLVMVTVVTLTGPRMTSERGLWAWWWVCLDCVNRDRKSHLCCGQDHSLAGILNCIHGERELSSMHASVPLHFLILNKMWMMPQGHAALTSPPWWTVPLTVR